MKLNQVPLLVITAISVIFAACGGSFGEVNMATIIGTLPANLANNTLADATQVMSDFNYIQSQVNANAASLTGGNSFSGTQTIGGDNITTNFASQTLTNKTLTSPTINTPTITTPAISNPAFSGTPTGNIASGTYTPSSTAVTNIASFGTATGTYTQVGNVVTVSIVVVVNTTSTNTNSVATFSLPVASNFSLGTQAIGNAAFLDTVVYSGVVTSNSSSKTLQVNWKAGAFTAETMFLTAQYQML